MPPPPPHSPPATGEVPTARGWARASWTTVQRASKAAKVWAQFDPNRPQPPSRPPPPPPPPQALFTRAQGPSQDLEVALPTEKRRSAGWAASLPLRWPAGRGGPDSSAHEEHGGAAAAAGDEAMFSRPYALSSAHEEVVSAFASGQRRLAGLLARQGGWDPAAAAAAEREAHLAILRDHFGRGFLRKALKMLVEEGGEEAAPLLGAPAAAPKPQRAGSPAPAVSIHATAWAPPLAADTVAGPLPAAAAAAPPLPPRGRPAAPSFRLTAHTSTEDEEVDVDANCCGSAH